MMLAHCVALAQVDRAYAWWAAKRYARESLGVLADLPQLLTEEMQRQKGAEQQEAGDVDTNEGREAEKGGQGHAQEPGHAPAPGA